MAYTVSISNVANLTVSDQNRSLTIHEMSSGERAWSQEFNLTGNALARFAEALRNACRTEGFTDTVVEHGAGYVRITNLGGVSIRFRRSINGVGSVSENEIDLDPHDATLLWLSCLLYGSSLGGLSPRDAASEVLREAASEWGVVSDEDVAIGLWAQKRVAESEKGFIARVSSSLSALVSIQAVQ